ncbi:hypothetical protein V6N12_018410 [Hibiscus sabdariffa]|uniref:EGF-like domain-containing protein n=1 Tax=Hibiscus sabdariffa TaxID=183260 RepID=A0ABR2BQJ1_9ROSI
MIRVGAPEACMPYFACSGSLAGNTKCQCPLELTSSACKSSVASRGNGKDAVGLVDAEPGSIISHLATSRNFLFDDVGSFRSSKNESDLVAFVKMPRNGSGGGDRGGKKGFPYIVVIVVFAVAFILAYFLCH